MYMTKEETEAHYGPMVRFYKEKPNAIIWHTYPVKENFTTYFFSFEILGGFSAEFDQGRSIFIYEGKSKNG